MSSYCSGCHRPIIWATTTTGKAIPLDPEPAAGGNVRLADGVALIEPQRSLLDTADDGTRYVSHFVTCEMATSFRRRPL